MSEIDGTPYSIIDTSGAFVRATALTKRYRPSTTWGHWLRGVFSLPDVVALDSVSFEIQPGLVGLVGPNGAGKTTLMRAIAGLITPDTGQLEVLGMSVDGSQTAFRRRVGYAVSGDRSHFWRLSAVENLAFFGALHGLSRAKSLEAAHAVLALVGLENAKHRAVREYSTGMSQRLSVARGLLGEPECLLLDEPTRGLDPGNAQRLRQFVLDELVAARGINVLWATHDPQEMKSLCTSLIVLNQGRVVADGSYNHVQSKLEQVFECND